MADFPIVLEPWAARRAKAGKFRFVRLLQEAVQRLGYNPVIVSDDLSHALSQDPEDERPSLWWRRRSTTKGGLVFREAWRAPFWRIEANYERWKWDIAREPFIGTDVDPAVAAAFCARLRRRFAVPIALGNVTLVSLQDRCLISRAFQECAPIEMVRRVIAETDGSVHVIKHPRGEYPDEEIAALEEACSASNARLSDGPTEPYFADAGQFVTMNSTTTIAALLAGLPVTLHAKADFAHLSGQPINRQTAEAYVYWYLNTTIRAGQPDAVQQIVERLEELGVSAA